MIDRSVRNRFFLSNLFLFLIPLTIPLVTLGSLSIVLTESYLKDSLAKNNRNLLTQTQQNLGQMMNTLDTVSLMLDNDSGVSSFFETLFTAENLEYSDVRTQNLIAGFLTSLALSKPFIQSIYVYYPNTRGYFYSTGGGRMTLDTHQDREWLSLWQAGSERQADWTVVRRVPKFADSADTAPRVTIFHTLADQPGVVVLNLDPEGLRTLWTGITTLSGQEILILNREGRVLAGNGQGPQWSDEALTRLATAADAPALEQGMIVSRVSDDRYGWIILSLTPEASLYQVPTFLIGLTVGLLLVSFVIGVFLTTSVVRLNFNQARSIMSVIESAERGQPLPPLPSRVDTIYEQITYDLLRTFVEQNYLKLQLSEKTARTRLLELETRQNQMNPHFLFNTLKTLYWKAFALSGDPNDVCVMIDHLSGILDYALRSPAEAVVLDDEVRTVRSYLAIQEVRFAGHFSAAWDYPPELGRCRVPKLLLQPVVENAIYHGIREKGRPSRMLIRIRGEGAALVIGVTDTGIGMDAGTLAELTAKLETPDTGGEHIGLTNTHQRIRLAYGAPWGLTVASRPGRGTAVHIRLPFQA